MPLAAGLQKQIPVPLPRKRAGDPTVRVVEVPDDDADAPLDLHARLDAGVVVGDLLGLGGRGGREREPDVELGDDGVDAEVGVGFLLRDLVGEGGGGAWGACVRCVGRAVGVKGTCQR